MRFDGKTTKRKITKFSLDELSAVPEGAQSPAKMAIVKAGRSVENVRELLTNAVKKAFKTEDDEFIYIRDFDEAHAVYSCKDGFFAFPYELDGLLVKITGEPFEVLPQSKYDTPEGDRIVKQYHKKISKDGADSGNLTTEHEQGSASNSNSMENPVMPDNKTPEEIQKELDALKAQNAELEALAKMSDDEKSYMDKMSDGDKKKWMEMSPEERKEKMKTAKAADERYTAIDGQIIQKSVLGGETFALLKSQDQRLRKMQDDADMREAQELVKSICPNLPGEDGAMAGAIRKCKNSLTTEEFDVLQKALKAGDAAMQVRSAPAGDGGQEPATLAKAREDFSAAIAKIASEKGISKSAAYQTQEGMELAKKLRESESAEA